MKQVLNLYSSYTGFKDDFSKWRSRDDFPRRVTCFSLVRGLSGCTSSTFSLFCSHFPLNSPLFTPLNDPQHPFPLISSSHVLSLTPQLNQQLLHNSATLETRHCFVDYCCYCTVYTQTGLCTWNTCDVFITSCWLHLHVCVRPLQTWNCIDFAPSMIRGNLFLVSGKASGRQEGA